MGKVSSESPKALSHLNTVAFFQCNINFQTITNKKPWFYGSSLHLSAAITGFVSEHQL